MKQGSSIDATVLPIYEGMLPHQYWSKSPKDSYRLFYWATCKETAVWGARHPPQWWRALDAQAPQKLLEIDGKLRV